jgi:hypothetical protein
MFDTADHHSYSSRSNWHGREVMFDNPSCHKKSARNDMTQMGSIPP